MPSSRQTRRPSGRTSGKNGGSHGAGSGAGMGVDVFGGPVIDPTENVLALVDAESKFQNGMREAESRLQHAMRDAESRFQNGMREAEVRRQTDLSRQKEASDTRIENLLRVQVENTSVLLSTQLDRVTNALGERITDLEKKSWETGGKSSVADPAMTEAIKAMAVTVSGLKDAHKVTEGKGLVYVAVGGIVAFIVMAVIASVAIIAPFLKP